MCESVDGFMDLTKFMEAASFYVPSFAFYSVCHLVIWFLYFIQILYLFRIEWSMLVMSFSILFFKMHHICIEKCLDLFSIHSLTLVRILYISNLWFSIHINDLSFVVFREHNLFTSFLHRRTSRIDRCFSYRP